MRYWILTPLTGIGAQRVWCSIDLHDQCRLSAIRTSEQQGLTCSNGTCAAVTETAARTVRAAAVFNLLFNGGPAHQRHMAGQCHP